MPSVFSVLSCAIIPSPPLDWQRPEAKNPISSSLPSPNPVLLPHKDPSPGIKGQTENWTRKRSFKVSCAAGPVLDFRPWTPRPQLIHFNPPHSDSTTILTSAPTSCSALASLNLTPQHGQCSVPLHPREVTWEKSVGQAVTMTGR